MNIDHQADSIRVALGLKAPIAGVYEEFWTAQHQHHSLLDVLVAVLRMLFFWELCVPCCQSRDWFFDNNTVTRGDPRPRIERLGEHPAEHVPLSFNVIAIDDKSWTTNLHNIQLVNSSPSASQYYYSCVNLRSVCLLIITLSNDWFRWYRRASRVPKRSPTLCGIALEWSINLAK